MTQDEIIEMAKEIYGENGWTETSLSRLEAFAKLVAAKEREACAKLAYSYRTWDDTGMGIADAIRAKRQA